ncbi:hypothetical protein FN846DRAFT_780693 [Sphaerosporella brunnea]|uniref:DNA-directed RNA polymerase II subunit RPB9-like zinc ribbon domain-containing protein n=1 Tax=Sphaerosporella brunnea TaxID=1250544 RepID=A0A5J5ET07_9PEZI|nr:hypothetical protein FN846DRAFT_780693 [Sphaerosporella brunnea]
MLSFCPQCSNSLTVSPAPSTGTNRLECRACPYEFILTRKYFERKPMKRKEVDDVIGGRLGQRRPDGCELSRRLVLQRNLTP